MLRVVVATSVSPARPTPQSFHRRTLRRSFGFLRRADLGQRHVTARRRVEVFQSETVSFEKFMMGEPKSANIGGYCEGLA